MPRRVYAVLVLLCFAGNVRATIITNTRPEIAQMAGYWEVDSVQISALANAQLILNAYPSCSTTGSWEYMQPSGTTATDGDEHINVVLDASGTGVNCDNLHNSESEIVAEIINASGSILGSGNTHAKARGIFRYYHEHAGEIKYEIHPMTERDTWNGSAFVFGNDYHNTIRPDPYGTGYALSTYQDMASGANQQVTVQVLSDNNRVAITYPTAAGADTANYGQFDGQVVQALTNDSTSPYITFHATNSPAGAISGARIMRCRLITNTVAYTVAKTLGSNQTVTVNILNRVDMLGISNVVASLGAGQSMTITQPLEWITLGLTNVGPNVPPTASFTGSPTNGTAPLTVTFTDGSAGSITNRLWSFGDGGTSNTTSTSVQYVYQTAGSNLVKLIASGPGGSNTNSRPNYIVVSNAGPPPPPSASFTGSPTNGTEPLAVTFADTSTGNITNRFWDFGDTITTNVTTNNVSHSYAAGTYNVMLLVTGPGGADTNTQPNYIVVNTAPPAASFSGSPTSGTEPLAVTFTDTSTGNITNRFWDFGDTTTTNVTTNSVSHSYAAGTYDVMLVVTGPDGAGTNTQFSYINALTTFQSWQVQYFGSTTNPAAAANADPDGDGCDNLCEFLSGTDPTNGASSLRITAVAAQGADMLVTWATAGGRTNVVQVTSGDVAGSYTTNFIDLSPFIIIPGSGDTSTNYLDVEGATNNPSRYYRIRLQP
jgi:PKD repeat protein